MTADDGKVFTVTAVRAAQEIGVHVETVKRWCRDGRIPARKNISGYWMLCQDDVDANHVDAVYE